MVRVHQRAPKKSIANAMLFSLAPSDNLVLITLISSQVLSSPIKREVGSADRLSSAGGGIMTTDPRRSGLKERASSDERSFFRAPQAFLRSSSGAWFCFVQSFKVSLVRVHKNSLREFSGRQRKASRTRCFFLWHPLITLC